MPAVKRTYRGVVRNGAIVLEPPVDLPEGAEVEVVELLPPNAPDWNVAMRYVGMVRSSNQETDISERVDELLAEAHFANQNDASTT